MDVRDILEEVAGWEMILAGGVRYVDGGVSVDGLPV